jgi:hypothetical protein
MLNCQTRDLCHETNINVQKNNNEAQFSINPISNDEIKKKNQCKKGSKKDRCQLELNS